MALTSLTSWSGTKSRKADKTSTLDQDMALVQRCQHGERQAQYELYEKYKNWVFNVAYRMANNSDTAEELTQMVFVRAFQKINSYRGDAAFSSWIYRMAVNVSINYFRQEKKRRQRVSNELSSSENLNSKAFAGEDGKPNFRPYLEKAISALPEGYRVIFILYDVEGYNHKEIGEMLHISEGTSKSQLHKARKELRQVLAPYIEMYKSLQ